jgi:hypothetical protein
VLRKNTKPENEFPDGQNPESPAPGWLQSLQENSWELELLISGGAVFTLIQLPDYFSRWLITIRIQTSLPGFSIYLILGMLGIKILTNGFVLHLILRAYWLAMVCLNFVFPAGISSQNAQHKGPFRNNHTEGDLRELIMKVDRICGLVIFTSISSVILLAALMFALGAFIVLMLGAEHVENQFLTELIQLLVMVFLWSGLLYFLDLLFFGFLRRLKYFSYLFYPFFQVWDTLTFRRLYARPLVFFGSNVSKGSFLIGASLFTMVTIFMVYSSVFRHFGWKSIFDFRDYRFTMSKTEASVNNRHYADESDWDDRQIVFIPSKLIDGNYLSVNVIYVKGMDMLIEASANHDTLRFVENILEVSIDDSVYRDLKWHDRWEKDMSNCGLTTVIPIGHLSNGEHILKVTNPELPDNTYMKIREDDGRTFRIPFWKDPH